MGQKVHPVGMRLGINKEWSSVWYADKHSYADYLHADFKVREYLEEALKNAGVSEIKIERPAKNAKITIYAARPGVIIGKKGSDVETLRRKVSSIIGVPAHVNIEEVSKPELDAKLVGENVAQQLERRVMFRRAMKRAVQNAMRAGALGIKITVAGRLGGAEIARTEWYREGRVPLHTLRADIDYATARANTTYGVIGIKVWIYKGEVFRKQIEMPEIDIDETTSSDKPAARKTKKVASKPQPKAAAKKADGAKPATKTVKKATAKNAADAEKKPAAKKATTAKAAEKKPAAKKPAATKAEADADKPKKED